MRQELPREVAELEILVVAERPGWDVSDHFTNSEACSMSYDADGMRNDEGSRGEETLTSDLFFDTFSS